jgi:hypothetical protein
MMMMAKTPLAIYIAYDMTPKSLPAAKDLFSSLLVCGGTVSIIKILIVLSAKGTDESNLTC